MGQYSYGRSLCRCTGIEDYKLLLCARMEIGTCSGELGVVGVLEVRRGQPSQEHVAVCRC